MKNDSYDKWSKDELKDFIRLKDLNKRSIINLIILAIIIIFIQFGIPFIMGLFLVYGSFTYIIQGICWLSGVIYLLSREERENE